MKKYLSIIIGLFLISVAGNAQEIFTRQDTLRGSITKERAWWDLKYYHLDIKVNPADSTISGSNTIRYQVLKEYNKMQIDLQKPMEIYKVIQDGKELKYVRDGNAFFIELIEPQGVREIKEICIEPPSLEQVEPKEVILTEVIPCGGVNTVPATNEHNAASVT